VLLSYNIDVRFLGPYPACVLSDQPECHDQVLAEVPNGIVPASDVLLEHETDPEVLLIMVLIDLAWFVAVFEGIRACTVDYAYVHPTQLFRLCSTSLRKRYRIGKV